MRPQRSLWPKHGNKRRGEVGNKTPSPDATHLTTSCCYLCIARHHALMGTLAGWAAWRSACYPEKPKLRGLQGCVLGPRSQQGRDVALVPKAAFSQEERKLPRGPWVHAAPTHAAPLACCPPRMLPLRSPLLSQPCSPPNRNVQRRL